MFAINDLEQNICASFIEVISEFFDANYKFKYSMKRLLKITVKDEGGENPLKAAKYSINPYQR